MTHDEGITSDRRTSYFQAVVTITILTLITVLLAHPPAQAALGDLTCTGQAHITFSPPLAPGGTTNAEFEGTLAECSSLLGQSLYSARFVDRGAPATAGATCGVFSVNFDNNRVRWEPRGRSLAEFTISADLTSAAFGGKIKKGVLAGSTATAVPLAAAPICDASGRLHSLQLTGLITIH